MKKYSRELKEKIVRRLMPPNAESVTKEHRETGIAGAVL